MFAADLDFERLAVLGVSPKGHLSRPQAAGARPMETARLGASYANPQGRCRGRAAGGGAL